MRRTRYTESAGCRSQMGAPYVRRGEAMPLLLIYTNLSRAPLRVQYLRALRGVGSLWIAEEHLAHALQRHATQSQHGRYANPRHVWYCSTNTQLMCMGRQARWIPQACAL